MSKAQADGHGKGLFGDFSLTETFGKVILEGAKLATIGLVAAVAWQVFLDPIFFPIFHDATNLTSQAWVHTIHEMFSWIPDILGLTGDGGLLNTDIAQSFLANGYEAVQPPTVENLQFDGF